MLQARPSLRRLLLPLVFVAAAACALSVDMPIARQFRKWRDAPRQPAAAGQDGEILRTCLASLDIFEPFGHGLGALLVVVLIHQLDPPRRRSIPRILLCAFAAGGAADLLKMLVIRIRPNDFDLSRPVGATFHEWLPLLHGDSTLQSFPSGHTTMAVGLAAALIWRYPQGRRIFWLLAILVGCQRIVSGAHYPSDVLLGAAIGSLVAALFLDVGHLPRWLDWWEGTRGAGSLESGLESRAHRKETGCVKPPL
jgi:undecaprenyl-diphosphatase